MQLEIGWSKLGYLWSTISQDYAIDRRQALWMAPWLPSWQHFQGRPAGPASLNHFTGIALEMAAAEAVLAPGIFFARKTGQ